MLLKIVLMVFNKSLNEDPRVLAIIQGMLMMRVPFDRKPRPEGTKPNMEKWSVRYGRMGRPPKSTSKQATATDGGFLEGDVSGCRQSF